VNGNLLAANTYDQYGVPGTNNQGAFQYTGQLWLANAGLYYYKNRIYSPALGRFLQTDPIGYGDGPNWYNYVHGDPVNGSDPSGLDGDTSVAEVVVTALIGLAGPATLNTGNAPDPKGAPTPVAEVVVHAKRGSPQSKPPPTPPDPESRNPFAHYDPQGRKDICQIYNVIDGNGGTITNGATAAASVATKGTAAAARGRVSAVLTGAQVLFALLDEGLKSAGAGCDQ
jgi:RHS repeat-associated protein